MNSEQDSFRDIGEVKELHGQADVNKLLKEGWVLLAVYTRNVGEGMQGDSFPNYVVGKKRPG